MRYEVPIDRILNLIPSIMEEIGGARALSIAIMARYGEFIQLAGLKIDPLHYCDRKSFSRDFMATEMFRKSDLFPGFSDGDRRLAALNACRAAEQQCLDTNRRLTLWCTTNGFPPGLSRILSKARRKIEYVLQSFSVDEMLDNCRWGPGSDALNKRPYVAPFHKFRSPFNGTKDVQPLLHLITERHSLWARWLSESENPGVFSPLFSPIKGNGWTTVPKTFLTDRSICVEPPANIFFQLGVGACIRRRLRRIGIDLNSQERNRMLALEGSESGSLATIDLSSASDTIARGLINTLFDTPKLLPWLRVMELLRSKFTRYEGKWVLNHKFSSMGNGFTFELETLVFWALSDAACEENGESCAAVYGDDIIVPVGSFDTVCGVLASFGFTPNPRKSYNTSPFRESCGMNAWEGYEVATYRVSSLKVLADLYSFHNGLRRLGLSKSATSILKLIPKQLRRFGPVSGGDSFLHNPEVSTWKAVPYGIVDQWFFWGMKIEGLVFTPEKRKNESYEPALLHSLATLVPLSDHPIYVGGRWGSQGYSTLSNGSWSFGSLLLDRAMLGLNEVDLPH